VVLGGERFVGAVIFGDGIWEGSYLFFFFAEKSGLPLLEKKVSFRPDEESCPSELL
jgi:hypothetical protein